ncbi:hypothetical protein JHL17_00360 [Azospirillum sp. YIM B02556]|uniref:DUF1211 domain-containing protein n=1 Tax=Azospirillum endophyticum TaxID=2800326 RepID=A0ABS1EXE6_9PROT|nr:hypothetical protein [Azospirillum endophyticum]MBK1835852.1 hypothetical protein [Azospirillum endophyticum]
MSSSPDPRSEILHSVSLGAVLTDTARIMRVRFDQRACHFGLTRAKWSVIATLARNEGIKQTALAACAFWVFAIHIATAHGNTKTEPSLDPALLRDRNFVTGLILIFVIGVILLAIMALLPPMLQNLLVIPMLLLLRRPKAGAPAPEEAAVME